MVTGFVFIDEMNLHLFSMSICFFVSLKELNDIISSLMQMQNVAKYKLKM